MEKEFIPHKLAFELKELGYDEPCLMYWYEASNGYVLVNKKDQTFQPYTNAPLYQQAFRWFREKYNIHCMINQHPIYESKEFEYSYSITTYFGIGHTKFFNKRIVSYEEAELACLKEMIEIIKNK